MIKRLFLVSFVALAIGPGCASTSSESDEGGEGEVAAEGETGGEDGLSDEPLGDGEVTSEDTPPADEAGGESSGGGETGGSETAMPVEKSLFDRVGGKSTLQLFASNFVDALATHADLSKNDKVASALKSSQKEMVADFFCMKSGGPCTFSGKDLGEALGKVKLNKDEYKVFRKVFVQTLRKMKVPKKERTELATIAGRQKKTFAQ